MIEQIKEPFPPKASVNIIISCCRLRKVPRQIKTLAGRLLSQDVLEGCSSESIIYLLHAFGKIDLKDRALGKRISTALERWVRELERVIYFV